jgi:hypothetical protein
VAPRLLRVDGEVIPVLSLDAFDPGPLLGGPELPAP